MSTKVVGGGGYRKRARRGGRRKTTLAGVEPAIFGFVDRRLIHLATRSSNPGVVGRWVYATRGGQRSTQTAPKSGWSCGVSIPVPLACKASALPSELQPPRAGGRRESDNGASRPKRPVFGARFRSWDLWVMGPPRFHCATPNKTTVVGRTRHCGRRDGGRRREKRPPEEGLEPSATRLRVLRSTD